MHLIQLLLDFLKNTLSTPEALGHQFLASGIFFCLLTVSFLLPLCGHYKYRLLRTQLSQVMQVCKANMWEDMKLSHILLSFYAPVGNLVGL